MPRSKQAVLIDLRNGQGHAVCLFDSRSLCHHSLKLRPLVSIKDQLTMKVYLGRGEKVAAVTNGFI